MEVANAIFTDFFRAKGVYKAIVKLDEWLVYKMKKVQRKDISADTSSFLLLFDLPHSFPNFITTPQSFSRSV